MKILVVGSGLCGASLARLLFDRGHYVEVIEKEDRVGGLCITDVNDYGLKYEPYGARTFHSNNPKIVEFIQRYSSFNDYVHRKGMIINNKLLPFPITKESLHYFKEKDQIFYELKNKPSTIVNDNFAAACISLFGLTLYNYFVENYTRKMWGIDPKELTADWAPKRLELRDKEGDLFEGQWQGLPVDGYSKLIENMLEGIAVKLKTAYFDHKNFDVVAYSGPIDSILDYKFCKLKYRSLKFDYACDETWEKDEYGTINLPQHQYFIRKCNFKILHKQDSKHNFIQYQEPIEADKTYIPMYPINTDDNDKVFNLYLKKICSDGNICPIGRLGLFKYLDMDKAVEVAFDMVEIIEGYPYLENSDKIKRISMIRAAY